MIRSAAWRDPRSRALIAAAVVFGSRAAAYLGGPGELLPVGLREVAGVVPVSLYGVLWGIGALALLVIAARRQPVRAWHGALVLPPLLWGALYLASALFEGNLTGGPAALLFGALALWLHSTLCTAPGRR